MLDEEHRSLPNQASDDNTYVLGRIAQHNVVMACLPGQYGTNNAAIVATNLKRSFPQIRATLMVGIGGGSPSQADLYLGDVVVGTRVMQYDMGKVTVGGCFQETAIAKTPASLLNSAVSTLRSRYLQDDSSKRITSLLQSRLPKLSRPNYPDQLFQASYEHPLDAPTCDDCDLEKLQLRKARFSDEPKIHYGVIASGNRVMKNGKARDDVAQRFSALCFEMESAGMMDNLQCLPIRGICDYADSHKSKAWQGYAAATAAAYARGLVEAIPHLPRELDHASTYLSKTSEPSTANSLSFPQIDARKTTIGAAHARTCGWLLKHPEYLNWLNPEIQSQNHGFLWMRGKAGAGKSTMMKFVFLKTKSKHNNSNMATASFFFNARGDSLERSVTGMYRSLLLQLLKAFPDLQSVFDDTDIVPWSQQDCPDLDILKSLLRSAVMALGQRYFTCFVDALDECDEQEVRDMVYFFEDLTEDTTDDGVQFRICFSSRPYPYIDVRHGILLILEDERGHADDLAQYVKSHLKIRNSSLLEELQAKILDKADGIFMWIVLVVEILNKEYIHGALALRKRISEIPAKLSDLFKSMLKRDQERPESLLLCVLWVLCAKRPLSPAEFQHALWAGLFEQDLVDPDLPDDANMDAIRLVTSSSKGLAEITKSKEPKVQFIHQSVSDFLVKERGLQDMWPELGFDWEGPSHERLKSCCATYLSLPGVQALVNGFQGGEERDKYSFLEYASQQILHHANAAALVVSQDDFLSHFFASAGIRVINFCEGHKSRRYSTHANPLYVLADKGLANLIRTRNKKESALYAPRERYEYPLFAALANGHKDAVAALLGLSSTTCDGVDIMEGLKYRKDLTGYKGRTPLSWAAQEGRLSIVKALVQGGIEKGADIHTQDKYGRTALIWASLRGYEAVAQLLIEKGADIHTQDKDGQTALLWASQNRHEAVAELLIEKGADIHTQEKYGRTALIWASQNGYEAVAELLIEKGADIHTQDKYGRTALIWASQNGYEAVAELLIEKGADIHT
ncbi:NACHT and ankyrin domain-containing protein [Colletotrichum tofieldiae]|nr:NACHT and ankyrin domain-containing protein [Colletotrichum tofieldiae]